jgi:hypothetical protein
MRVQIPAYTDRWMRGDRYGEVVKVTTNKVARQDLADKREITREIAHVKLDISGKTLRYLLVDCTVVS